MRRQDVLELELSTADLLAYAMRRSWPGWRAVSSMAMTDAVFAGHLKRLQLPYFAEHHAALMAQAAREPWPHGRYLEQLVEGEVARRDEALVVACYVWSALQ